MLTKCFLKNRLCTYTKKQMPKNQMLKKCKHDLSSNQHTEKVMKYKKKLRRKVNMLQCPSSLTENE